jgi:hypothetical protein
MDLSVITLTRPHSYWDVVGAHLPLALLSGIALLVSKWVSYRMLPLMPCTFLQLTGYPCPFCGFTRSFWAMASGDLTFAVTNCPLACLAYFGTVLMFAWNMAALVLGVRISRGRSLQMGRGRARWMFCIISALFVLNWAYRLCLGLQ